MKMVTNMVLNFFEEWLHPCSLDDVISYATWLWSMIRIWKYLRFSVAKEFWRHCTYYVTSITVYWCAVFLSFIVFFASDEFLKCFVKQSFREKGMNILSVKYVNKFVLYSVIVVSITATDILKWLIWSQ